MNTKAFTANWRTPAISFEPSNQSEKLAIRKKPKPVAPDKIIQNFLFFIFSPHFGGFDTKNSISQNILLCQYAAIVKRKSLQGFNPWTGAGDFS
jgi:hypothetical protein